MTSSWHLTVRDDDMHDLPPSSSQFGEYEVFLSVSRQFVLSTLVSQRLSNFQIYSYKNWKWIKRTCTVIQHHNDYFSKTPWSLLPFLHLKLIVYNKVRLLCLARYFSTDNIGYPQTPPPSGIALANDFPIFCNSITISSSIPIFYHFSGLESSIVHQQRYCVEPLEHYP